MSWRCPNYYFIVASYFAFFDLNHLFFIPSSKNHKMNVSPPSTLAFIETYA
jgi:hypothetical protein